VFDRSLEFARVLPHLGRDVIELQRFEEVSLILAGHVPVRPG
jgi:hypothetical protein